MFRRARGRPYLILEEILSLIDLRRFRLERYLEPRDGAYTRMTTHERGESLAPGAFPDVAVPLAEILPR